MTSMSLKKKPNAVCALKTSRILEKGTGSNALAKHLKSKKLTGSGSFNTLLHKGSH